MTILKNDYLDIENPFANLAVQQLPVGSGEDTGKYVLVFRPWNVGKNEPISPTSSLVCSPAFISRKEVPFWCSTNLKFRGRFVSTADWTTLLSETPNAAEAHNPAEIKTMREYYKERHSRFFTGAAYTEAEARQILMLASDRYQAIYIARNSLMTVSDQLLFDAARQLRGQTS